MKTLIGSILLAVCTFVFVAGASATGTAQNHHKPIKVRHWTNGHHHSKGHSHSHSKGRKHHTHHIFHKTKRALS
jgi:hypothetical protein